MGSVGVGLWHLIPLSTIFQLYRGVQFYWWRKQEYLEKNQPPTTSNWQTLSDNIVLITPCLSGIWSHNIEVIGTDCCICIGSCKFNYHTIVTTMVPYVMGVLKVLLRIICKIKIFYWLSIYCQYILNDFVLFQDMSNYEWHYFYNFFWSICPWYIAYIAVDWIVYKHMSIVSIYCFIWERIFGQCHDIVEILLKFALNNNHSLYLVIWIIYLKQLCNDFL